MVWFIPDAEYKEDIWELLGALSKTPRLSDVQDGQELPTERAIEFPDGFSGMDIESAIKLAVGLEVRDNPEVYLDAVLALDALREQLIKRANLLAAVKA